MEFGLCLASVNIIPAILRGKRLDPPRSLRECKFVYASLRWNSLARIVADQTNKNEHL